MHTGMPRTIRSLFVSFLAVFVLSLTVGLESLHNHEANETEHPDCPVVTIGHAFSCAIVVAYDVQRTDICIVIADPQVESAPAAPSLLHIRLRGPPVV